MTDIDMIELLKITAEKKNESTVGFNVVTPPRGWHDDFTDNEWNDNVTLPQDSTIRPDDARANLESHIHELGIQIIKQNRSKSYPPIDEQLDMIYWDKINNTNHWINIITEIKQQNPKPEGN